MQKNKKVLLSLKGVKTYFPIRRGIIKRVVGYVKAVDGVDMDIYRGETIGLVGESGCGKTTLGKAILRLVSSTEGEMNYNFDGEVKDLKKLSAKELSGMRKKLQIIFQDPYSSLNPAFTIFGSLQDPLKRFGVKKKADIERIIGDLLEAVNLRREYVYRYPHEFSSGQRQRIGIARALSVNPEFIICDEAVSALDVSIRAQVIKLLQKLKEERNLTYLFITHDLSVVEYISDRVAVMYLGRIVELANNEDLFSNPLHPYTKALISAIPVVSLDKKSKRIVLKGDVPSPVNPPGGCPFHPRCPECKEICKTKVPELKRYGMDNEHFVSCNLLD